MALILIQLLGIYNANSLRIPMLLYTTHADQRTINQLQQLEQSADLLLDEFLMTALRSVKDRPALLKIEAELEQFVQDTR